MPTPALDPTQAVRRTSPDRVGWTWLIRVRWASGAALAGAFLAGANLATSTGLAVPITLVVASVASNTWLAWRLRAPDPPTRTTGGWLVVTDILLLSWMLRVTGGVLNPASIFYLVNIVLAALVLGRLWAWVTAGLSVAGYGGLFLAMPSELSAAGAMHPEIGLHIRGMWLAFAATALLVAMLVSQLASLVDRRDRALESLRERAARDARLGALATLSAGAAHELSTPLATIAVAARELEHTLTAAGGDAETRDDVRLIRAEVDRCRKILDDMNATSSQPSGAMLETTSVAAVVERAIAELTPAERSRVQVDADAFTVTWPSGVVVRGLVNLLRNALQASDGQTVDVVVTTEADTVRIAVRDAGTGMTPEVLARAGEPFFTSKANGTGMGLGLFVTRAGLDPLGGSVSLSSTAGEGTTATIVLPVHVQGVSRHE